MKIGYEHAIKGLVDQHKKMTAQGVDSDTLKSIAEGIEYLCYPYREDLTESVPTPLYDPQDKKNPGFDEDEDLCRRVMLSVQLKNIAWDALQSLRE